MRRDLIVTLGIYKYDEFLNLQSSNLTHGCLPIQTTKKGHSRPGKKKRFAPDFLRPPSYVRRSGTPRQGIVRRLRQVLLRIDLLLSVSVSARHKNGLDKIIQGLFLDSK